MFRLNNKYNRKIQKRSGGEEDFLKILKQLMETLDDGDLELVFFSPKKYSGPWR